MSKYSKQVHLSTPRAVSVSVRVLRCARITAKPRLSTQLIVNSKLQFSPSFALLLFAPVLNAGVFVSYAIFVNYPHCTVRSVWAFNFTEDCRILDLRPRIGLTSSPLALASRVPEEDSILIPSALILNQFKMLAVTAVRSHKLSSQSK